MKRLLRMLWEKMRYGSRPGMSERSNRWPAVEAAHKRAEARCQWCGRLDHVEVHHVVPFEERPDLELVATNLISLCRPPGPLFGDETNPLGSCHFQHGHTDGKGRFSWKLANPSIRRECEIRKAMGACHG